MPLHAFSLFLGSPHPVPARFAPHADLGGHRQLPLLFQVSVATDFGPAHSTELLPSLKGVEWGQPIILKTQLPLF